MSVIYHEDSRIFHLSNNYISYVMRIMENDQMENLYYGKRLNDSDSLIRLHEEVLRSHMAMACPEPSSLSMQYARQEYPVYGTGDFKMPACQLLQENGSRIACFTFDSYTVRKGKPGLEGLPAVYVEDADEAETLELTLRDRLTDTTLKLFYTLFRDYPAIARHAEFVQQGQQTVVLERAMSGCVELPDMDYEMLQLSGAWARERYIHSRPLEMGLQGVHSLTGTASSAEQNPFIALKRPETTEEQGEVYGFSLVYSGNFMAEVEVSTFDAVRVNMGINPLNFSWRLEQGEAFVTPEMILVYSDHGLNKMSQTYQKLYRTRLARGFWRDRARPILLNNWEGTYFDFNEEMILQMAREAKNVGVELFVLDDGWFGSRDDDYRGLGDWFCNRKKIPSGIEGLSEKIESMGLKFGLWFELEMINKDSELYRAHPDWMIQVPGRFQSPSRHQHVLDFSRQEVVDYIGDMVTELLRVSRVSYIKWDMNRYMTEPFSSALPAGRQGEFMHRYILGVYRLYERLTRSFPEILFESCAGGGSRFDPGMLYYAPQAWCSDDTDGWERVKIQYGTSMVYPTVSMGSHVSAVPNHQVRRITPLSTRANTAYFGTFGYELVLGKLSDDELEQVKAQIAFMKKHRELIQIDGTFYRLRSPFCHNEAGWITVSSDQKEALAGFYQRLNKVNASLLRFRLAGLDPDQLYQIRFDICGEQRVWTSFGDALMHAGIPVSREDLDRLGGDFASIVYEITAV